MAKEEKKIINKPKEKKSKNKLPKEVYYFYSLGCAWCKKLDPIVDELVKDGYNIIKLDVGDKDNREAKTELETKFNFKCGTPSLVEPKSGEYICGYKEKNIVEKLCKGEKIPQPPRPKSAPPKPPNLDNHKDVSRWEEEYEKWREDNKHVPNLPKTEMMLTNLKRQFESAKKQQLGQASPATLEKRLTTIEQQLAKLMSHLGVK
tara:strand:- start:2481 stop:3092 length:612 start_codon:yes stop_codon:yes gene_type:complete